MMTGLRPARLLTLPPAVPVPGGRGGSGRPVVGLPLGNPHAPGVVPCGRPGAGVQRAQPQQVSGEF